MKIRSSVLLLLGALAPGAASALHAQVPDSALAVSYQGNSLLRVNINGAALFGGTFTGTSTASNCTSGGGSTGCIPAEGSGTRMMWLPNRAAFRAGYIDGTQWDDANTGNYSVAMGQSVRASGDNGTAFGLRTTAANGGTFTAGIDNTATGFASVALGIFAHTNARQGTFVFSDRSMLNDTTFASTNHSATFRVRCGMRLIMTTSGVTQITKNGNWEGTGVAFGGPGVDNTCTGGNYLGQTGAMISTSTGAYLSTSGTWTNASDVNRKHRFLAVSGQDVLDRLRTMPVSSWSYRVDDTSIRHIGPTAQDFRRAFGVGNDSVSIATVDADGVALAAAKALDERGRAQQAEIEALRAENAELKRRLDRIEAMLKP